MQLDLLVFHLSVHVGLGGQMGADQIWYQHEPGDVLIQIRAHNFDGTEPCAVNKSYIQWTVDDDSPQHLFWRGLFLKEEMSFEKRSFSKLWAAQHLLFRIWLCCNRIVPSSIFCFHKREILDCNLQPLLLYKIKILFLSMDENLSHQIKE